MKFRASLCLSAFLLSGCGWQLQGSARLPPSMLSIRIDTTDAYSDFYRELRSRLQSAGAQVQPGATAGAASSAVQPGAAESEVAGSQLTIVRVHSDQFGQRVLSVSTLGTPEEYEVFYRVEYSVQANGMEVIARQPLELTNAYSYDSRAVLAKQREQFSMQQALARELASLVVRRLGTVNVGVAQAITPPAPHAG